ncbi:MAG: hypothetical protein ACLRSW_09380 [Christensenellaceae bacterium]
MSLISRWFPRDGDKHFDLLTFVFTDENWERIKVYYDMKYSSNTGAKG